jgi:hypothetical protein
VCKYQNAKFKENIYFVNEVKTQLREKPFRDSQTQKFYYLEDKASNKIVIVAYLRQRSYLAL